MVKLRGKETLKYSPYEGESEAQQGGEDSHQVQVDEGPPWLEHLDQHLALAGQRVQQDLLLQLILNIETSQTFSLSLDLNLPDSFLPSRKSFFLLDFKF